MEKGLTVYHLDETGRYICEGTADPDPMQPGKYLVPRNAVTTPIPADKLQKYWHWQWTGRKWIPQYDHALHAAHIERVRHERNQRLYACDWTQLPDAKLSVYEVFGWQKYRQQLRDITALPEFPNVEWPVQPGEKKEVKA